MSGTFFFEFPKRRLIRNSLVDWFILFPNSIVFMKRKFREGLSGQVWSQILPHGELRFSLGKMAKKGYFWPDPAQTRPSTTAQANAKKSFLKKNF